MASPIQNPRDDARVLDAVRRIVAVLHDSGRRAEQRLGITGAQLFVLRCLADAPARSVNELAERTRTHQSSVSVVVTRLVARKLVRRARAADDARRQELSLTAAGRALLARAVPTAQERLAEGLDRLASAQRRRLADALEGWLEVAGLPASPAPFFLERDARATQKRAANRRAS